ncbi:hypothetical protein [Mesorhizobium sp. B2-1-2]|uniref:hypothetical protein n=1 Tax=Mesorhizobium sp. B2-1-2 TaxID=2589973 RepID=UPI00112C5086|nr:hypothetical protein [Mesorhizobium sp. B2-1-2]TPN11703.1 hypothetical protein FJ971_09860 [Mesorhizobium sp. B2-1-2]
MKTNRRGFLGLFGAGAVAGPRLAAGIAENVAMNMPVPSGVGYALPEKCAAEVDWKLSRIAKLKKMIRGKDPLAAHKNKMHAAYMADNSERVRLDGLRSVSPGHKIRMLIETSIERQERIRRADVGLDLARLLNGED